MKVACSGRLAADTAAASGSPRDLHAARLDAVRRRAAVCGGVGARQRRHTRQVRGDHVRAGQRQRNCDHACRAGRMHAGHPRP